MPNLTNGLVAYLLTQQPVTAIVGQSIQPIPAPEDLASYPLITYQSPSFSTEYANDGPIGVAKTRIVFDCCALRYLDARNLALTLASVLSGFGVVAPDAAIGSQGNTGLLPDGTQVYEIQIVNIVDGWDDGSRIYSTSVHAMIQYEG